MYHFFQKYPRTPSLPYLVRIQDSEFTKTFDLIPYINMIKQEIHVDVQGLTDEKMSLDLTYECNKTGSMLRGNPRWTILFLFKRKVSTPVSVQIQLW